jgi:hypothetical protein
LSTSPANGLLAHILGAVAFGLSALFVFLSRFSLLYRCRWVGSDTFYLFIMAALIREQRTTNVLNARFVLSEREHHPPLVPVLLSKVGPARFQLAQCVGPSADLVTFGIVLFGAHVIWGPSAALLAGLVYGTTPSAFDVTYSLTPRALGNVLLGAIFVSIMVLHPDTPLALAICAVLGSLILLTHRLTSQSLLATLVPYALIQPLFALFSIGGAVALAMVWSKGYYATSLGGHITFLRSLGISRPSPRSILQNVALALAGNPHFVPVLIVIAQTPRDANQVTLLYWITGLAVVSIWWPFGQGHRHFANASVPVALFLGSVSANESALVRIIVLSAAVGGAYIVLKNAIYPALARRGRSTVVSPELLRACARLRECWRGPSLPLVLVWPHALTYQVMYFAQCRAIAGSGGTGPGRIYNITMEDRIRRDGLAGIGRKDKPDFIVHNDAMPLTVPGEEWSCIFREGHLRVYRRNQNAATTLSNSLRAS